MIIKCNPYSTQEDSTWSIENVDEIIESVQTEFNEYLNNYKSIQCVTEASVLDFLYTVLKYIKKFLKILDMITDKFRSQFSSVVKNDTFILKSRDDINNYNPGTNSVIANRFVFTHIDDDDIPLANPAISKGDYYTTVASFAKSNLYFGSLKRGQTERIRIMNDDMEKYNSDFLSEFAAAVLKRTGLIPYPVYPAYCAKVFRNGYEKPELSGVVSYEEMQDTFTRFSKYRKMVEDLKSTKQKIKNEYDEIYDLFQKKATEVKYFDNSDNNPYQDEMENEMRRYYQIKGERVQHMTNIHLTAFSAKMQAMKDSYQQDREILLRCIENVVNNKKDN